jgi:hypothetical protein
VHRIEALGLSLRQVLLPHRADREARLFDAGENLSSQPPLDGVGLDDRKRSFHVSPGGSASRDPPYLCFAAPALLA